MHKCFLTAPQIVFNMAFRLLKLTIATLQQDI